MSDPLRNSLLTFMGPVGKSLSGRCRAFSTWRFARQEKGIWPFYRTLDSAPAHHIFQKNSRGGERMFVNFGATDYLALSQHAAVHATALEAIPKWGTHSTASPILVGTTTPVRELEDYLAALLHKQDCLLYPTGWAAGFGVLAGLVRQNDFVVLDALSHNCLQEGARHATKKIVKFPHNDLDALTEKLAQLREQEPNTGIFVVSEGLFSMDSDSPDLRTLTRICREYEAISIVDIAHDFGSIGQTGFGALEGIPADELPEVIMGSFSKTFATNGGFLAGDTDALNYLRMYSPSLGFSTAISPVQACIAQASCQIVFSEEGAGLREQLMHNVYQLREGMKEQGFQVGGIPSPIVPVFVGSEPLARLASRELQEQGVLANLVEFPAVGRGLARFRFQLMPTHTEEDIACAVTALKYAVEVAQEELTGGCGA